MGDVESRNEVVSEETMGHRQKRQQTQIRLFAPDAGIVFFADLGFGSYRDMAAMGRSNA
ncbi:MAG TPA: hypothetical protein VKY85_23640 [Candidatus Angelobacter sp.]|nr:hypothetical protein [Candidatus Angelobacter sp.]